MTPPGNLIVWQQGKVIDDSEKPINDENDLKNKEKKQPKKNNNPEDIKND